MTLIKHRQYGYALASNLTDISAPDTTGFLLKHLVTPATVNSSLLRTRAEFTMHVTVGGPSSDVPPQIWWHQTYVTLYAYWIPSNSSAGASGTGSSEHYLGSQFLAPKLTPDPTNAGAYVVTWTTDDPLETSTSRRAVGASTGPSVNWYISIFDIESALTGFYSAISIDYGLRFFALWGDNV